MKKFFSFLIFAAVVAGAVAFAPVIGQKLDMPYEAGQLHAPDIDRHHGAATESGHEAPAHEEAPAESHG